MLSCDTKATQVHLQPHCLFSADIKPDIEKYRNIHGKAVAAYANTQASKNEETSKEYEMREGFVYLVRE